MAETFRLRVRNPLETLLESDQTEWVHLRLADGTGLTVYPGHAPLLAETVTTQLRYANETGEHAFNAEAGILQVKGNEVTVFTSSEAEVETTPDPSAVPEARRFEQLARRLRAKLEGETDSALADVLKAGDE